MTARREQVDKGGVVDAKRKEEKKAETITRKRSRSIAESFASEHPEKDGCIALDDLISHVDLAAVRLFDHNDLVSFEYHRTWASIPDLHALLKALLKQQQLLTAR